MPIEDIQAAQRVLSALRAKLEAFTIEEERQSCPPVTPLRAHS